MDIERATELTEQALATLDEGQWLIYDESTWDIEAAGDPTHPGPDLNPGVTEQDVHLTSDALMALGPAVAGHPPGTPLRVIDEDPETGEIIDRDPDPERGEPLYATSVTLTEGLARARKALAQFRIGAPAELVAVVQRSLALVDEALAALDLSPDDWIVKAAAEDGAG